MPHVLIAADADWLIDDVRSALEGPDTTFAVCRTGQAVTDAETVVLAPLTADLGAVPMATVPLLSTDVHDLQGLAEIADLLFDRRSP